MDHWHLLRYQIFFKIGISFIHITIISVFSFVASLFMFIRTFLEMWILKRMTRLPTYCTQTQQRLASYHTVFQLRPRTHWQFYPTREPFANGSRRVARVHTASTASGSSGTLRPHQDVFAVDANGSRRLGSAVWMLEWTRRARRVGSDAPSANICKLTYLFPLH